MATLLGDIEFLNSWPVTYALRLRLVDGEVKIISGTPAQLNQKLLTGELDCSAVSSMLFLRHLEELVPIPELCIRSDGGVHSVLVVSRQPLEKLRGKTVGVSNQGATTPVLLKILLAHRGLKMNLQVTPLRYPEILQEFPAALLIGDEALVAAQDSALWLRLPEGAAPGASALLTWDLGEAWTSWTKLPAVFALWVMRRKLANEQPRLLGEIGDTLRESLEWGKSHREELIGQMRKIFPLEATFLRRYLSDLSYDLNEKAWAGLRRFAREAERIGESPRGTEKQLSRLEPWKTSVKYSRKLSTANA